MKRIRLVLTIYVGHLMLGNVSTLYSASPNAEDLERKAIKYRLENIKQGYVRMLAVDDPSRQPMERLYENTFDENQVRQTRRIRRLGKEKWGEAEKIIVTPKLHMSDHGDIKNPLPARITPTANNMSLRKNSRVLNLQALGMDINGIDMLHTADVESLLNRADRSSPTVQADPHGDLETWRIDYELKGPAQKNATHVSLWIAPSQGFSVVSIKMRTNQEGKLLTSVIDSQLKQYPVGDIWFPSKVTRVVELDGLVLRRQVTTVEEARFGEPVDEAAFTPAGLELKPGREVVDSTSGQPWLKVWDGKKLADSSGVQTAPANPDRRHWVLWALAIGLALLSIFYIRRIIRQRRSASNPGV